MEKECTFNLNDKTTIDRLVDGEVVKFNGYLERRGLKVYAFTYETFARNPESKNPIKLISFAHGEEPSSCKIAYFGCCDNFRKKVSFVKDLYLGSHLYSMSATEGKSKRVQRETVINLVAEDTTSAKELAEDLMSSMFWPLDETISFKMQSLLVVI